MPATKKSKNQFASDQIVLYTVSDIQEIFKIGRSKAYRLMHTGTFPSFVLEKKLYVTKNDLEEWIAQNMVYTNKRYKETCTNRNLNRNTNKNRKAGLS